MAQTSTILKIAVPTPLRRLFDYLPPRHISAPLQPGMRVSVPFGNRKLVGVLVATDTRSNLSISKLKAIDAALDPEPLIPVSLIKILLWCAQYYHQPVGEVFSAALPGLLRKGYTDIRHHEISYQLTGEGAKLEASDLRRAPRQQEILTLIKAGNKSISEQALKSLGLTGSPLKALLDKGWISAIHKEPPSNTETQQVLADAPLPLNDEQKSALSQLTTAIGHYHCFLLEGVTGSGKTEVYLQAIEQVLRRGLSGLVLVPEIGLTPQTVARFQHRFRVPVAILHSNLSDQSRLHDWMSARDGRARIIIGTRSAVFTPIPQLGIIIVDEEHDLSFKQQEGLRYSARDIAIMRAHDAGIPVVLGSATPSLESLHNVRKNNYRHLQLSQRAGGAFAPTIQLLDIRSRPLQAGLSQPLISAIAGQLEQGNQVLVFLNRRGFAPTLMCHQCGWIASCSRCDTRMTLHSQPPQLRCHHCDKQQPVPTVCSECRHPELHAIGTGTARSEEKINELFPDTDVLRIDRDSTRNRRTMEQMVAKINEGSPCILVGTQMLAKGHHFPNVTLVAILDADHGLFSSDFRGLERMGQLITQVAGRAGRGDKAGQVVIQTHQVDHPLLSTLVNKGYAKFAQHLLVERQQALLPPFRHMALIRAEATLERAPIEFLRTARSLAEQLMQMQVEMQQEDAQTLDIFGPIPAVMPKRAGRYRAQLTLQAEQRKHLHPLLNQLSHKLENLKEARRVRWSIDVDPMESL